MHGARVLIVVVLLGILPAGCATVTVWESRVVTGQVTDESGQPVADTPVIIVARSLELAEFRMQYVEEGRQEVRATTDAQGGYRIELVPAKLGNNFFLFFYDKTGFDRVKFQRSEAVDITSQLKHDRLVTVNQVLRFQVTWPEVERQVIFYGPDSDKGKILRKHGLPEKREALPPGDTASETWWYYADGVSYWFAGDTLARTHEFPPVPAATATK
jgi:hypothetical protein